MLYNREDVVRTEFKIIIIIRLNKFTCHFVVMKRASPFIILHYVFIQFSMLTCIHELVIQIV